MLPTSVELDFKDVLILPRRTTLDSRGQVSLKKTYKFRSSKQEYSGVPIIASNMDTVGTFAMAKTLFKHDLFTTIHKHASLDEWLVFAAAHPDAMGNVAISCGIGKDDQARLGKILQALPQIRFICIDVANGYAQSFVEFVKATRSTYPTKTIIAGNVVTGEMVQELLIAGADIVKVGIGPGSVCTTRLKTGVGRPQLTAVHECAKAAHSLDGHVISDGGCVSPGDVCKAFGAGADFVMLGGMLAGHDQCPGEVETDKSGDSYKIFYGMSSKAAQDKYNGGLADYRASEGKVVKVPYRGDVSNTILDVLGGLRSACTYTGSAELANLPKNTEFIGVRHQLNEVFNHREVNK